MPQEQLLGYIKKQIEIGVSILDLKKALISKGWKEEDVDLAINEINKISIPQQRNENYNLKSSQFPISLKSKKAIIIFIISISILLITLGVLGYYFYSQNNPDFIYKRAVIKTLNLKNIEFEVKGDFESESVNASYKNSGQVQVGDNPKDTKIRNTLEVKFPNDQSIVYGSEDRDVLSKIVLELFFTNNEIYINAPEETRRYFLGSSFGDTYGYGTDWIKVDKKTFKELESLDVGNLKKLNDLLFNLKDVEITYIESEKKDKVEYLKYSYKIPRKTTDKLLYDFYTAFKLGDISYISNSQLEELHQLISNGFIWVNKKDVTVSKIVPTIPYYLGSKLYLEYNLKSFGNDLKLETPKNYIDFEDFIKKFDSAEPIETVDYKDYYQEDNYNDDYFFDKNNSDLEYYKNY